MKPKTWKIIQWVLSVFFILSFFVYLPHYSAFLLLAAGVLLLPIKPIQGFWYEILRFRPWMKGTILALLILVGVVNVPTTTTVPAAAPGPTPGSAAVAAASMLEQHVSSMYEVTPMPTTEVKPTAEPTLEPTPEPTNTPTPAPTAEPTPKPTPKATVTPEPQQTKQSVTVYVTNTGEKYHTAGCQYLKKSQIPIDLNDALAQGYEPCSKCHPPRG